MDTTYYSITPMVAEYVAKLRRDEMNEMAKRGFDGKDVVTIYMKALTDFIRENAGYPGDYSEIATEFSAMLYSGINTEDTSPS